MCEGGSQFQQAPSIRGYVLGVEMTIGPLTRCMNPMITKIPV